MISLDQIRLTAKRNMLAYAASHPEQQAEVRTVLDFMEKVDNPFTRHNLSGHITASAWVVDPEFSKTLLIKHASLGKWLQPGGHIDIGEWPAEAAVREAREETGIQSLQISPPGIIDVDIHRIPANEKKGEPEHTHYDLRYLVVAESEELSINTSECDAAEWVRLDTIINGRGWLPSILRMAEKSFRR